MVSRACLKRRFMGVGTYKGGSMNDVLRAEANSRMSINAWPASRKSSLMSMPNIEREITLMARRIISWLTTSVVSRPLSNRQRANIWSAESTMISANWATPFGV